MEILTKLELDAMQATELEQAIDITCKYNFPAMVINPLLIPDALLIRIRRRGRFKLIVPIDWPKGESFGILKMRGMTKECLGADGFEILLTGEKNETETRNEAQTLSDFISKHISPMVEIRFVLGAFMRTEEEILRMCAGLVGIRTPTCVRIDHHLKVQPTKGNIESQTTLANKIKQIIGFPLKASGNFTTVKTITSCDWATKIAVGTNQAQQILDDLNRQPDGLREMLT